MNMLFAKRRDGGGVVCFIRGLELPLEIVHAVKGNDHLEVLQALLNLRTHPTEALKAPHVSGLNPGGGGLRRGKNADRRQKRREAQTEVER
jgi:hypothetical protein